MDSATVDLHHMRMKELVYDEGKIITCLSIAGELKVSLDAAKVLMKLFVEDSRQIRPHELTISYVLSGTIKDNKLAIYLVKEDDLQEKKAAFNKISSEIIYSIQKDGEIDFNCIAMVDKAINESPITLAGSVVSKNCVQRDIKTNTKQFEATTSNKQSQSFKVKEEIKEKIDKPNREVPHNNKQSVGAKSKQSKPTSKSGAISSFLSKLPLKAVDNVKKEDKDNGVSKTDHVKIVDEEMPMEVESEVEKFQQNQSNPKKRKKKNKSGENSFSKKRKRIQEVCDSDSSDMFDDEENIIEGSDGEVELVQENPPMPPSSKGRIMKAIDKMHQDEDGYMVTSTDYVFVDAPEEDNVETITPKIEEKLNVLMKKKNSSTDSEKGESAISKKGKKNKKPMMGKQSTLMNFIKKA